ncbi:MAG TPA: CoA-binding protein [Bacillota bacterium]|jgi:acyl-CoA synthetase (NDP forming)
MGLERLFQAESVAVVGASATPGKLGHTILSNLIEGGFKGPIYPVNRKESEILGLKAYPNLLEIPADVDLMVVAVPSGVVLSVVQEAIQKKIGVAIIVSGGFREAGNLEGERELVRTARAGGLRIVGPNCQGLAYLPNNLCATWPVQRSRGPIAVVSQSGTVAAALADWAAEDGLGISCMLAMGNKTDINETDAVNFLSGDGETKAIAVYSEGLGDGKTFMEVLKRATAKIPVVLLRGGRTPIGHAAAQTHTKSLAGQYQVFASLAEANGAAVVDSIEDLYDGTKALACLKAPAGRKVCIITSSGGAGVLATDAGFESGLELAKLDEATSASLREKLPSYCSVRNPIDLTGDATWEMYETVLRTAATDRNVDSFLVIFGDPIPGAAEMMKRAQKDLKQPFVVVFLGGGEVEAQERKVFAQAKIPVFSSPERAMRGLGLVVRQKGE